MPSWLSMSFQDASSPSMNELFCLHEHIMVVMVLVLFLVSYILLYLLLYSMFYKYLTEGTFIETIWSIIPAFLLLILVVPSMKVLYFMEDIKSPSITVKVIAHQWYWSYVLPTMKGLYFSLNNHNFDYFSFDSMMENEVHTQPRLMSCSSSLLIPLSSTTRFLISSMDVIHAFSIPSLGMKVDAFPGRINQLFTNPTRLGVFYGQCSEICGSNHSFMPIELSVIQEKEFNNSTEKYLLEMVVESSESYKSME